MFMDASTLKKSGNVLLFFLCLDSSGQKEGQDPEVFLFYM